MKTIIVTLLSIAAFMQPLPSAQAQANPPGRKALAFTPSGDSGFAFDTGVLRGKLCADGKSKGLSAVVHIPSGLILDSSLGLFSHYRVFSANHRFGTAAWDWPSRGRVQPDGSVEVRWPATDDRPFELRAVYRWAAPAVLDLETSVLALTNLVKFESFLASYFSDGFTNAAVYVKTNGNQVLAPAEKTSGVWLAYPRDEQAAAIIKDGRWTYPPSPVDWVIMPPLAKPVGIRRCPAHDLQITVMSTPEDCFAVMTPFQTEPHRSLYLARFGKDLKAGETLRARSRMVIGPTLGQEGVDAAYRDFLQQRR